MSGFVKIYGTALDSSVWSEPGDTVKVWITLLVMADKDGIVRSSLPGLVRRAAVSQTACEVALAIFLAPDPYSQDIKRDPTKDGRRIEEVPEGWRVINANYYRDLRTDKQISDAERQRKHREARSEPPEERDTSRMSQRVATDEEGDEDSDSDLTTKPSPSTAERDTSQDAQVVTPEYDGDVRALLILVPLTGLAAWQAEIKALRVGMHGKVVSAEQMGRAIRDYLAAAPADLSLRHFRAFVRGSVKEDSQQEQTAGRRDLKGEGLIIFGKLRESVKEIAVQQNTERPRQLAREPDDEYAARVAQWERGDNHKTTPVRQVDPEVLKEMTPEARTAIAAIGGVRVFINPPKEMESLGWQFAAAFAAAHTRKQERGK